jgi:hypothetical protein
VSEKRRYSKATKVRTVIAAEMTSVAAAAEQAGIPETTVAYWFDAPEFVDIRRKTREDLAEESMGMAHKVLGEIKRRLDEFEPRDLSVLYGILTDKGQLLSGGATTRSETKDLTALVTDHEREALRIVLDDVLRESVHAGD